MHGANNTASTASGTCLSKTVTSGSGPSLSISVNPTNNQIQGVSGLSYDANGNQNVGTYDAENRLSTAGGLQYAYDGQNERIWSWNGGTDGSDNPTGYSVVMYSPTGQKLATYQLTPQWLQGYTPSIWMQVTLASSDQYFGGRRLAVLDQLGSAGTYFPWGEDTRAPRIRRTRGVMLPTGATRERMMDYANNRYYSNAYGRFMTPDPYKASGRPSNPQTWNRYTYTGGDPVNRIDPSGTDYVTRSIQACATVTQVSSAAIPGGPGFCDASEGPGACTSACVAVDGFTPMPGPNCAADGGALPVAISAPPVELDCTLRLFPRPAKFKGNPGQHTYLTLRRSFLRNCGGGARQQQKRRDIMVISLASSMPQELLACLGQGRTMVQIPDTIPNLAALSRYRAATLEILIPTLVTTTVSQPGYAFLPNGTSTFNSNSFTYTLLEDLRAQNDFGSLPTNILGGIPFYPGWGYTLPGLNVFGLN